MNLFILLLNGSVENRKKIFPAAHCIHRKFNFRKLTPQEVVVRTGAYNLTNQNEEGVIHRNVSRIIIHPDWNAFEIAFDADIAILVLSSNITFSNNVQPICIPSESVVENIEGIVVGWGIHENNSLADIPRQASVKVINDSHCFREDQSIAVFSSTRTFCGGNGDGTPDRGDSGGGLFAISGSVWAQYGIVSAIRTNATGHITPDAYTIYTNVTSFKRWIIEIVNQTEGVVGEALINVVMKCDYDISDSTETTKSFYGCWLYDVDIQGNNVRAVTFTGSHLSEKTNDDIELLHFVNGTMFFLPNGIGYNFENVKHLIIGSDTDSNPNPNPLGTKRIRRSDFQNMENVVELSFVRNNIETINEDSLWDLSNLQIMQFVNNKLKVLSELTFIKNGNLKEIYMNGNQLNFLPANVFQNNLLLEVVDFRNNFLTTLDENLFGGNSMLLGVSFVSNELEVLPRNLFKNNSLLKLVDFKNNSLTSIDDGLFETNGKLSAVSFAVNRLKLLPENLFTNNLQLDIIDFRNNSLKAIDENLLEKNVMMKSVSFASNKIELLQRDLFKNNVLLEWVDFFNNVLEIIDIDFVAFRNIRLINLVRNSCIDAMYKRNDRIGAADRNLRNLLEFQNNVAANCSVGEK